MTLRVEIDGSLIADAIPPTSLAAQTIAKGGNVGFGGFDIEDPAGSIVTSGHKLVTITETDCAQSRLFTGWTTERGISRSVDGAMIVDDDRSHDVAIVDVNAAASFRIITYATGKRPEETMGERLTWLLAHQSFVNLAADTGFVTYYDLGCDAADFTGGTPKDVLDDLAGRKPGITWFLFWDTAAGEVGLYFGADSTGIAESTLSISNAFADVNPNAGVYPPDAEAKLRRSPEEVYSEVMVTYGDQSKMTYRKRESTSLAFVARGTTINRPYTQRETTAQAQAEAFLDDHATETDTISTTILVFPEHAGLVLAGQRIDVKFTHLDDYTDWTSMRVVSVNVRPATDVASRYFLDVELEKPKTGTVPATCVGGPFLVTDATHNIALGATVTGFTNTGASFGTGANATDGDLDSTSANWDPEVFAAGTWYEGMTVDLGAAHSINLVSIKSTCATHADFNTYNSVLLSNDSDGSTGSTAGTISPTYPAQDFGIWTPGDFSAEYWTFTPDVPVVARYIHIRKDWTQGGLAYDAGFQLWEVAICGIPGDDQEEQEPPASPAGTPVETAANPTIDDDVADGYHVGQVWVNTSTGDTFILTDNTEGAAVWLPLSSASLALDDLTDVDAPTPADGDVLTWDDGASEWVAAAPSSGATLVYSVVDYDATGDGTTDDTTAIEAAITAADATSGGTIYFPPGTYKITTTITLTGQNYHLLGAGSRYGPSRIHMATANTTALSFAPSGSVALRTKTSLVQNLVVSGPGGASSGRGIDAANDLHAESVFVYGFYDGIYLRTASYYSYIARSTFTDCDRAGVVLDSTNNTTIDTCRFTGAFGGSSAPIGTLKYGIYIGCPFPTGIGTKIVNSSIEYFTDDGIYVSGLFGGEISGNYFETQQSSSGFAHLHLGSSHAAKAVFVHGNYFQGDGTSGFLAIKGGTTDRVTVASNYFGINSAIGIDASPGTNANWLLVNNYNNPAGTFSLPSGSSYTLDPANPPATVGTPALTLGTSNVAGGAITAVRTDATIAAFDATAPTTLSFGGAAATGSAAYAARRDHSHGMPATPSGGGQLLITDVHSTPLVFADIVQNETQDDLIYADP